MARDMGTEEKKGRTAKEERQESEVKADEKNNQEKIEANYLHIQNILMLIGVFV